MQLPERSTQEHDSLQMFVDGSDTNMLIAGFLSDLAAVQTSVQRKWGYKQAAAAIRGLDKPIEAFVQPDGALRRIPRIGPASTRVILEVLRTGASPTVASAMVESNRAEDVGKRRGWRGHFLSRARVNDVLTSTALQGPRQADYRGDLQMHSTWSDGSQTLEEIIEVAHRRGYSFSAVTDHSAGLPIARGLSSERFAEQWSEIDRLNKRHEGGFRLLKGVEANIRADGDLDIEPDDRRKFEIIVAAPHSGLRSPLLQTDRMLAAVTAPGVHILGHPRGRMYGSRPGVSADWPAVFAAAAREHVAVEIDGDPSRQDLDFVLARAAVDAGCLFALNSDAHSIGDWPSAEIALAHARLANVPTERVINCWPLERLIEWSRRRSSVLR